MSNCFKSDLTFEDIYDKYTISFICRKSFCIECYGNHNHNNVDSDFEDLLKVIKEKSNTLYTPLNEYSWNNCLETCQDAIMERIITISICRQRSNFISFHKQMVNIKERFKYLFIEMVLKKYFVVTSQNTCSALFNP